MSDFASAVVRLAIEPHPNADAIELARVGDFQSIVKKGQYKDGQLAVYLQEASIIPEKMLREMGFWNEVGNVGTLHGAKGDRVKAIKLRGVLSQGIIYDAPEGAQEGDDASEQLGVVKYEPKVPQSMMGKAIGADWTITHKYDFNNIKAHPTLFGENEEVVMTEKIHGTNLQIIVLPSELAKDAFHKGRVAITSKGMGGRGIILDHNDLTTVYAQACVKFDLLDKALDMCGDEADERGLPVCVFGEVFGGGIQDLGYDTSLGYAAFDISVGVRDQAEFVCFDCLTKLCEKYSIPTAPLLYRGPLTKEALHEHTNGKTTIGNVKHIREGVVVKAPGKNARNKFFGRKIAKSISEAYLLRKDATEFA